MGSLDVGDLPAGVLRLSHILRSRKYITENETIAQEVVYDTVTRATWRPHALCQLGSCVPLR